MKTQFLRYLFFALSSVQVLAEAPVVQSDGSVSFKIDAPDARRLQIDVQGRTSAANNGEPFDMVKSDDGVWSYTSEPLDPGFHYYLLYIDGYRFADTSNPLYFGWQRPTNGVEIPDPKRDFYLPRKGARGEVSIRPYFSEMTQSWREVYVYMPPQYASEPDRKFPVLYLQHGSGENQTSWSNQGRLGIILDNLIADKECEPMIVVMENGYAHKPESKADESGRRENHFEQLLVEETIPVIESHYRVLTDPESRAIAGLSMGAGQALRIALQNLDRFSYLGCFSGAGRSGGELIENSADINEKLKVFWMACGTEDRGYERIADFHQRLESEGIGHEFFSHPGTHEWQAWRLHLYRFAPQLFKR